MLKFKKGKKYVNISLDKKAKEQARIQWLVFFGTLKKGEIFLILFSFLTFVGIFAEKYFEKQFLNKEKEYLHFLKEKSKIYDKQIEELKDELSKADTKFKDFYIPSLKEKLFYILYNQHAKKVILKTFGEYSKIVGTTSAFVGVLTFPNPYFGSTWGNSYVLPQKPEVIYKPFQLPKGVNLRPNETPLQYLPNINKNYVLIIPIPETKGTFFERISQIKNKEIKANLLLEYSLIKYGLKNLQIKTPLTLLFPVNIALPSESLYKDILTKLKRFCTILQINKEFKKEIYFQNKLQVKAALDALCIKNVY